MSNLRTRLKRLEADQPPPTQRTLDWHALATEGILRWDDGTPIETLVPTEDPIEALIAEEINSGKQRGMA